MPGKKSSKKTFYDGFKKKKKNAFSLQSLIFSTLEGRAAKWSDLTGKLRLVFKKHGIKQVV